MNLNNDGQSSVACKICRRQLSRYTCPSCSISYCSLVCFRSPAHSDCSETFYKKEIQNGINSQPARNAEERLKMMEILKRFEENSVANEGLLGEEEEDEDDLANRFEGLDLENAAYEDIWDRLTEDEKSRFLKAVENPESDLGKDLLAHSREECKPWWEGHLSNENQAPESRIPEPMKIPSTMVRATVVPTGPPLIYNLCAICIAYAYTTRHFVASPLTTAPQKDARDSISKLVPFLADRKSTTLHTSLDDLIVDIWSRFNVNAISNSTLSILMKDVAQLMRTRSPISVVSNSSSGESGHADYSSHPSRYLVFVLSDLHDVYSGIKHVTHKLLFYAAHILSTPPAVFHSLAVDLEDRSKELGIKGESELRDSVSAETTSTKDLQEVASNLQHNKAPLIKEI